MFIPFVNKDSSDVISNNSHHFLHVVVWEVLDEFLAIDILDDCGWAAQSSICSTIPRSLRFYIYIEYYKPTSLCTH